MTGSADEGSGSIADIGGDAGAPAGDGWVPFFDATDGHDVRPLLTATLEAAGPPRDGALAVELGSGSGVETLALLRAGWTVHAMDGSPEGVRRTVERAEKAGLADRLTAVATTFEEYVVPAADLVYAGLALPFCHPDHFPRVWDGVRAALRPGAVLGAQLFGVHDTWANTWNMNFHSRDDVELLLTGLDVLRLDEEDEDGESVAGPKHWHVFDVLARNPSLTPPARTPGATPRGSP